MGVKSMRREPITVDVTKPETMPPRAEVVRAFLTNSKMVTIQFDPEWGGGRGGWFDENNRAVAEKAIARYVPNH